jgi:hypothetical protein
MATRSYIGVRNLDSSVDYIYCHFDGYPEHNGKILTEHYSNINRVNELLNLGDLSVLGQFIGEKMDFDKRIQDTCLAYGRDRGESNVDKKNSGYDELITDQNVDYVYVFDGDYWECHSTYSPELINLYNITSSEV